MISFIVPAHNEEFLIARTLDAINIAASRIKESYEVIVVDDASTDKTAKIARTLGAQVHEVNLRKISAVRNAGARQARGDCLIFVDADTLVYENTLKAALKAMRNGSVGGGALINVSDRVGLGPRVVLTIWNAVSRMMRWAPGCFVFARRDAFDAIGGFDEQYYVTEELYFSHAIKRQGRFAILSQKVYTSGRKARMYTMPQLIRHSVQILLSGPKGFRQREGLDLWYNGRREKPNE